MSTEFLMILGMFIATFGVRYVLFAVDDKMALPDLVLNSLKYVPVAVLSAIIVPSALWPDPQVATAQFLNPFVVGTLVCAGVAWKFKNLNLTIFVGFIAFYFAKYLFTLG